MTLPYFNFNIFFDVQLFGSECFLCLSYRLEGASLLGFSLKQATCCIVFYFVSALLISERKDFLPTFSEPIQKLSKKNNYETKQYNMLIVVCFAKSSTVHCHMAIFFLIVFVSFETGLARFR